MWMDKRKLVNDAFLGSSSSLRRYRVAQVSRSYITIFLIGEINGINILLNDSKVVVVS